MGDLRTKRTYKLLSNALLKLLAKKSFDEIKVNDICDLAMVHRTTFYSHFSDKYELLDYCIDQIKEELTNKINKNKYSNIKEFYTNLIMSLLKFIGEKRSLFKGVLNKNSDNGMIITFSQACTSYISNMLEKNKASGTSYYVPTPIISEFYTGAFLFTINWWLKSNSKLTEKELCDYIIFLIFNTTN